MLNRKLALTTVAVSWFFSGSASAAPTSSSSQQALQALMRVDIPQVEWVNQKVWKGVGEYAGSLQVDSSRTSFSGNSWVIGNEALACDTWAGVLCVDGDIRYLEIPFSQMHGDMAAAMAALAPIKDTLRTINFVGSTNLRGTAEGLQNLTALEGLYIDNTGVSGELPDLSGLANLRFAGLNDNMGLTGIAGGIGGAKLEILNLNNTPNFQSDITRVLETSKHSLHRLNLAHSSATGQIPDYSANTQLNYFVVTGSGLGGQLNLSNSGQIAPENLNTAGTGISAGQGTSGSDISPSILAVSNVTAAANGANAMVVGWSSSGTVDGFIVSYSIDGGANWSSELVASGNLKIADVTGLAAGTYLVSVTAYRTNAAGVTVQSTATHAPSSVVISNANTPVTPSTPSEGTDSTDSNDTSSGNGGGGAALWFAVLPALVVLRRRLLVSS